MKKQKKKQKTSEAQNKISEMTIELVKDAEKYRKFKEEMHTMMYLVPMIDDCVSNIDNLFPVILDKGIKTALRDVLKSCNVLMNKVIKDRSMFESNGDFIQMSVGAIGLHERLTAVVNYFNDDMIRELDAIVEKHITDEYMTNVHSEIQKELQSKYGDVIAQTNDEVNIKEHFDAHKNYMYVS